MALGRNVEVASNNEFDVAGTIRQAEAKTDTAQLAVALPVVSKTASCCTADIRVRTHSMLGHWPNLEAQVYLMDALSAHDLPWLATISFDAIAGRSRPPTACHVI